MKTILFVLLFPFALLYGIVIHLRNWMFDRRILKQHSFAIPVICVGNITVGGTGKTPMTDLLISIFKENNKIAVLSRGYGRKTKGFLLADKHSALEIGDEPFQLKIKHNDVIVAVDEKRVNGVKNILKVEPSVNLILLDDAFQHRYVKPDLTILMTDYNRPIYNDCLLPLGRLREPAENCTRADVVVVNKCPDNMSKEEKFSIKNLIPFKRKDYIFFSSIVYADVLKGVYVNESIRVQSLPDYSKIIVFTAIAQPDVFFNHVKKHHADCSLLAFPDHHYFKEKDFVTLEKMADEKCVIITTEKDCARLQVTDMVKKYHNQFFYWPVELSLRDDEGFMDVLKKME
jgi:tetraacyldisaccharide 4'-kinase